MNALPTCPTPIPQTITTAHEHGWRVESRHSTSDGTILYVRCGECHVLRVDLQPHPATPPEAMSKTTPATFTQ